MNDFNKGNVRWGAKALLIFVVAIIAIISVATLLNVWTAGVAVEAFCGWAGVVNFFVEGFLIYCLYKVLFPKDKKEE